MGTGSRVLVFGSAPLADRLEARLTDATVVRSDDPTDAAPTAEAVDCVVTDHDPPVWDCFAALTATPTAIPVVVSPVDGTAALASDALGAGAADFVHREDATPESVDPLAERVEDAVAEARERAQLVADREQRVDELKRYETIVEAVPDSVYAVDEDGYVTFTNERAAEQFGFTAEAVAAGEVHFTDTVAETDLPEIREAIESLLGDDDRERATVEYTAVTQAGRRYPAETHFAVTSSGDRVAGAGVSRDVTERTRRERRLDVLDRVLRHNLRNELTAIINIAEAIELRTGDPAVAEDATRIREFGSDLAAMSDRLRKLAAVIDESSIDDDWTDAVAAVETAVEQVADDHPEADIRTDLPDSLTVAASPALEIPVVELLENAIEHTDSAEPTVDVSLAATGDGWVALTVADAGPGIPETERAVVEREEMTPLQHGSGLGLWAVVWIVEAFNGEVSIRDREPRGTAVTIRLKRRQSDG